MFFLLNNYKKKILKKGRYVYLASISKQTAGERMFLSISKMRSVLPGSMTVEAALALPIFIFAMLTVLQFASITIASSALLAGMQETSKEMAVYAYVQNQGISAGDSLAGEIITGGLSAAYAKAKVQERAGAAMQDGTYSIWKSSFLRNEMIDIVGTYQPARVFTLLPVKKVKVILRTRVRAWTGREGHSSGESEEEDGEAIDEEASEKVYVAETGKVYHKDPNCTHIRLSIKHVSKDSLSSRRNANGGKYHACEKCGAAAGGTVYITSQGDRYHSSLTCSGLKRTVHECSLSDLDGMRACSKCGGGK